MIPLQRVIRVKKVDEGEEEGIGLTDEEITALSQGTLLAGLVSPLACGLSCYIHSAMTS